MPSLTKVRAFSRSMAMHAALAILSLAPAARADEEIIIGQDGAGRLVVLIGIPQPLALDPSPFPGIQGYATGSYGFANADIDMPEEGVFMLDFFADIQATLIGADPGIQIYDGLSVLPVGGVMSFGVPYFDYHPVFNITHGTPGAPLSMRFVAHDQSGIYADSPEFEVVFTPSFCPADFDGDGTVDFFDYDAFVACFEGAACPPGRTADFDADETVDFFDYDAFVLAFESPC